MSRSRLSRLCSLLLALWATLAFVNSASAQKAAIVTATRSAESAWWQYGPPPSREAVILALPRGSSQGWLLSE